jgi:flagellar basal body rod protein FlgF
MAASKTKTATAARAGNTAPLRTRDLERAVRHGSELAAEATLKTGRPITIAQDGWVVRQYPDGSIERVKRITPPAKSRKS